MNEWYDIIRFAGLAYLVVILIGLGFFLIGLFSPYLHRAWIFCYKCVKMKLKTLNDLFKGFNRRGFEG